MRHPVSKLSVDGAWRKMLHLLGFINTLKQWPGRAESQLVHFLCDPLHVSMSQLLEQTLCLQGRHSTDIKVKLFSKYFWLSNLTFLTQKPRKVPLTLLKGMKDLSGAWEKSHLLALHKENACVEISCQTALLCTCQLIYIYIYIITSLSLTPEAGKVGW